MTLLVDTSVWSLALRRDDAVLEPAVDFLQKALRGAELVVTTGLILQELLQGFNGPKSASSILERFHCLPLLPPDRRDHIAAAEVRNVCRRAGVQIGTIDALLIQLCGRHQLTMLSTDRDFLLATRFVPFRLWSSSTPSGA